MGKISYHITLHYIINAIFHMFAITFIIFNKQFTGIDINFSKNIIFSNLSCDFSGRKNNKF